MLLSIMVALPRLAYALYLVRHGNASEDDLKRLHGGVWPAVVLFLLALLMILSPLLLRALHEGPQERYVVPPPRMESAGKTCNPPCSKGQTCCNGTCCAAAGAVSPVSASLLEWTEDTLLLHD
jgi:hypothetical protein